MDFLQDILMEQMLSSMNGFDNMVNGAVDVLTGAALSDDIWNAVVGFSQVLHPFCQIVIAICLLIEVARVAAKVDIVKWEVGLKLGVKAVFAKVCIDIAPDFLRACYVQANEWISAAASFGSYQSMASLITADLTAQISQVAGLWSTIGLFVTTFIISIATKICGIMIYVIAFGRMFELYVYLAVSPFPCAFFPLGDGTGGGFSRITQKFFKSFVAVCLQGLMILICLRLFHMVVGTSFTTMIESAKAAGSATGIVAELNYTMLMGAIVLVMAVARCGSWAKSIIDVM